MDFPDDASCIPNINTEERRKRLVFGGLALVSGLAGLAALIFFGLSPWWRLALFPIFAAAATGYFQWAEKT